jgi:hypothetical protein
LVHLAGPEGRAKEDFLAALLAALQKQDLAVGLLRQGEGGVGLTLLGPEAASSAPEALRLLRVLDLVISLPPLEPDGPVVEFCPPGSEPRLGGAPGLLATVGEGDAERLAGMLAGRLAGRSAKKSLAILADGRPLPAKAFVQDILANTIHGLLSPLKGAEGATRLEVIIE